MPRHLKFPEMAELLVGQSLFITFEDDADAARIRVSAHTYAKRNGLVFETHVNHDTSEIEIARKAVSDGQPRRFDASVKRGRMSKAELKAEIDRIAAELDAS